MTSFPAELLERFNIKLTSLFTPCTILILPRPYFVQVSRGWGIICPHSSNFFRLSVLMVSPWNMICASELGIPKCCSSPTSSDISNVGKTMQILQLGFHPRRINFTFAVFLLHPDTIIFTKICCYVTNFIKKRILILDLLFYNAIFFTYTVH